MQKSEEQEGAGRARPQARKAYERPRIIFREPLEVAAVICSSTPGGKADTLSCPTGPISS